MKIRTIVILACIITSIIVIAGTVLADGQGPAPNSGDCIPDGSGFDSPNGPNGEGFSGNGHGTPAPNSGDGVSDGPGW